MKRLTYHEAVYLKHVGKTVDTKVTIHLRDEWPCVHIQDYELMTFESSIRILKQISDSIIRDSCNEERSDDVMLVSSNSL